MHAARDIDQLLAAEWALEELSAGPASPGPAPASDLPEPDPEALAAEAVARALAGAAEERDRMVAEAYAQGFEEGRAEGEAAEGARLAGAVRAAEAALDELREGEVRWTGTIEENVCALAVAVARRILERELGDDGEGVAELVRAALSEFPVDQPVRIRVHPADLAVITSLRDGEGKPVSPAGTREAHWMADPQVGRGGCLVEGRERIVDGRVDAALERVYRRLTYTQA